MARLTAYDWVCPTCRRQAPAGKARAGELHMFGRALITCDGGGKHEPVEMALEAHKPRAKAG